MATMTTMVERVVARVQRSRRLRRLARRADHLWRRYRLVVRSKLGANESQDAKAFWSSYGVRNFYEQEKHWSAFMAEQVIELGPERVLEFGCNVGRNLVSIRERAPEVVLQGVDINAEAIEHGKRVFELDLQTADEEFLSRQADGAFDVVFTISVLDHVPNPGEILEQLVRVARRAVLLLEPYTGKEGKVVRNVDKKSSKMVDTTPFSYSWDYEQLARGLPVSVERIPYALEGTNLGPFYYLYTLSKS